MQNRLQQIQWDHQIFNDEIEPEHEAKHMLTCACDIHQYKTRKQNRVAVLKMWSEAVMYPGEAPTHYVPFFWVVVVETGEQLTCQRGNR